jgi:hypothetical protein
MAQKKGRFVIKNAEGVVTLAGIATSLTNDVMSVDFSDITEISEHRDAGNVPRTLTKDFNAFEMRLQLTPGIGFDHADQASVKTAIASLAKGQSIVTASFEDDQFNWASGDKAIIWEVSKALNQGGLMSVNVTARKLQTAAGSPAAIDFTSAWADL